jgi:fatty acid desaturase
MAHHRFTHDPENDPELAGPKPDTLWAYLKYLSGLPEFRWRIVNLLRNAVTQTKATYVPPRGKAPVMAEARLFLLIYGILIVLSILLGTPLLIWVWLLPMLIAAPALRGYLLAEHARCPHVADMLSNTRTTFTNRVVRWLAWNMPYHAEHHSYPAVPFHKLPELHAICADHLKVTQNGYVPFNAEFASDAARGALKQQAATA